MKIIEYTPQYKNDFIRLNTAWIERYFCMEEEDYVLLNNIDESLEHGSMIYFAVENSKVLATGMALPINQTEWEICKLATDEHYQGKGAGSAVFKACMDYAAIHGAKRLTIVSNTILKPALHIYKKFGFKEISMNNLHSYQRGDIQLEYIISKKTKEQEK